MELFTPEIGLVFWMFVVFVILFVILAKFGWPYILRSLDERAEFIDKGVEYAQEAKSHLDNAQAEAKALLVEAQKQQMEILHEAAQMKTQIIEEARQAASVEAKKVMDAAKESELQFRREVSQFALQIAEKMMRKQLSDDKTQVEMVDKLLNEIENQN